MYHSLATVSLEQYCVFMVLLAVFLCYNMSHFLTNVQEKFAIYE